MSNSRYSLIIPTVNRCGFLDDTLASIVKAYTSGNVELIIIDNGSTDKTRSVVEKYINMASFPVRYVYEPCPGLHVGRNLGAQLAQGKVLAYLDDDIYMQQGWFEALFANFDSNPDLALLGGPCLPAWESAPPQWLEKFKENMDSGWVLSVLSLLDLGEQRKAISGNFVFGCNYCIRKSVLMTSGGFHPDGVPARFLKYRGDGETGVAQEIERQGSHILYDPYLKILHRVPVSRLSTKYILSIFKRNAYSYLFWTVRNTETVLKNLIITILKCSLRLIYNIIKYFCKKLLKKDCFLINCTIVSEFFKIKHGIHILFSKELRKWCKQKTYFKEDLCPYFITKDNI